MSEEKVDHPRHYGGDVVYEAIKVIEAWGLNFSLGTALKYICRHGKKPGEDAITDLRKAAWYCTREAARIEQEMLAAVLKEPQCTCTGPAGGTHEIGCPIVQAHQRIAIVEDSVLEKALRDRRGEPSAMRKG